MFTTPPAPETLTSTTRRPITWHDHGDGVWARLVCLRCGLERVHHFAPRYVLGAEPYGSSLDVARRRLLGELGASSIEHHRAARVGAATVAAIEACRRMGIQPRPIEGEIDAGPFAVFLCEAQTHFEGYPQWCGPDDSMFEVAVDGRDPNPLSSLTQRLRGTRAEGYADELVGRALGWRTWRLVGRSEAVDGAPVAAP